MFVSKLLFQLLLIALVYDEALLMPIGQLSFLCASGPRAAVSGLGLIKAFLSSAPYEEVQLKSA